MLSVQDRKEIAIGLAPFIEEAGHVTISARAAGVRVDRKLDESPVSNADTESEACILDGLCRLCPEIPVLSEESIDSVDLARAGSRYFLVDPLDGTKEFIAGGDDFAVIIGLIEDGRPTLGLLCAPAREKLYLSWGKGAAVCKQIGDANLRPLSLGPDRQRQPVILTSRSHLDPATSAFLSRVGEHDACGMGSALKFAVIADGEADLYPRFGPTMLWDVAGGQAILEAAGGAVLNLDGEPLRYDPVANLRNPSFIAAKSEETARAALRNLESSQHAAVAD